MDAYDPANARFREELGRTIRLLRIDQRLERQELADAAGISYSYLSAIENGQKAPSFRLLYGLAEQLGLRDDELLAMVRERLAEVPPPAPPPAAPRAAAAPAAAAPAPAAARSPRSRRWRARSAGSAAEAQQSPTPDPVEEPIDRDELAELLARLEPGDARAVLDLARRLAGDG